MDLTWNENWSYDSVTILRDGVSTATLADASTTYTDTVPAPGMYAYEMYGTWNGLDSVTTPCTAEVTYVPPAVITLCDISAEAVASLQWTNAVSTYEGVEILIDGAPTSDSPLPGDVESYDTVALEPGQHTLAVRPFISAYQAIGESCTVTATLPPVSDASCTILGDTWDIELTWANGWSYGSVTLLRNGVPVTTMLGAPTTYVDTAPAIGTYTYEIIGSFGAQDSTPTACTIEVDIVPAVKELLCQATTDRVGHLKWTNRITYDAIRVVRDGAQVASLPGDTTTFDEPLPAVGLYSYEVVAIMEGEASGPVSCTLEVIEVLFRRGDSNSDGSIDIADPIFVLGYLFRDAAPPGCLEAANVNDDSALDIADVVYMLSYIFRSMSPPRPPFPACGVDPDPTTSIGCLDFPPCATP